MGTAQGLCVMHDGAAVGRKGSTNSDATVMTVKEFIIRSNNPQTKLAAVNYALAGGRALHAYAATLAAKGAPNDILFCIPDNVQYTDAMILRAANQATEKSNGDAAFELSLLHALIEMFP
jgi:hypothetical protein